MLSMITSSYNSKDASNILSTYEGTCHMDSDARSGPPQWCLARPWEWGSNLTPKLQHQQCASLAGTRFHLPQTAEWIQPGKIPEARPPKSFTSGICGRRLVMRVLLWWWLCAVIVHYSKLEGWDPDKRTILAFASHTEKLNSPHLESIALR